MYRLMIAVPLVLCLSSEARGQDEQAETPNTELARRHYELGEQLYRTSAYQDALTEFQKAYRLVPRPELLFNIARCHEVMAQLEPAIEAYEKYLKEKPDDNAELVRSRLANLRRQLEERKKQEKARAQRTEQAGRPTVPAAGGPEERPRRWKRTAGWITAGIGVASLAVGAVFGALARQKADEYQPQTKLYSELQEIDRQGRKYNTVAIATLVAGGVAAAAGAGLLVWDLTSRGEVGERKTAVVVPFIDPSGAGIAGHFELGF